MLATFKVIQYIQFLESYMFVVKMFIQVLSDLMSFITLLIVLLVFFSVLLLIMGADVSDADYPNFDKNDFVRMGLQILRNSLGDIDVMDTGSLMGNDPLDEDAEVESTLDNNIALVIIWAAWFLNLLVVCIVLLNLLIAEVNQTYDRVKSSGTIFLYRGKSDVNLMTFKYRE